MMNLKDLEYSKVVCEQKSITRIEEKRAALGI